MALLASPSAAQSSTVFVTSALSRGNYGGLSGADANCQFVADRAGLPLSETYKAWLSDSTGSPDTRFYKSPGPYTLIDGTILADNWDDLIDGSFNARINIDQDGNTITAPMEVWTNTKNDGTAANPNDCNNWTSKTNSYSSRVSSTANDSFQPLYTSTCNNYYQLYCFQQLSPQAQSSSQSQDSSQLTANTWAVTYQGDAAVDFTSGSTNEVTLSYLIGAGKTPTLNLYASPDCSAETAVTAGVATPAVVSQAVSDDSSLDTLTVGIDIDKTKIVGSNIWDATDSSLEFCLAVTLESGGEVITEE